MKVEGQFYASEGVLRLKSQTSRISDPRGLYGHANIHSLKRACDYMLLINILVPDNKLFYSRELHLQICNALLPIHVTE